MGKSSGSVGEVPSAQAARASVTLKGQCEPPLCVSVTSRTCLDPEGEQLSNSGYWLFDRNKKSSRGVIGGA